MSAVSNIEMVGRIGFASGRSQKIEWFPAVLVSQCGSGAVSERVPCPFQDPMITRRAVRRWADSSVKK